MTVERHYEIEAKNFEDLRTAMVAYHKEQQQRWAEMTGRLQRQKWEYRTRADEHEHMVEFWTAVVFKPVKRRKRNYTGIS